jgi:hypothetical protein
VGRPGSWCRLAVAITQEAGSRMTSNSTFENGRAKELRAIQRERYTFQKFVLA